MIGHHKERNAVHSLLMAALLAISSISLLPLHAAHAAPQRPLTGCSSNNFKYVPFGFSGFTNTFYDDQYYTCQYPNLEDDTWFKLSSGTAAYIVAQGDTWLTQQPYPGGQRYGETGRSSQIAYPNNDQAYFIQEALYQTWLAPIYGCNWVNFPFNGGTHDYNCGNMR